MRETIIDILQKIKPGVDYDTEINLVDDKILESMEILRLVSDLSDEFDVDITLPYIRAENFQSVDTICSMIIVILEEE